MHKKTIVISLIAILIISIFIQPSLEAEESVWWDENWKYHQKIYIPIDTSLEEAKYQPIDIRINFNNSCWAKDELEHSIRILCLYKNSWYPLDLQIYDLGFVDSSHISSCSIVFLIPEFIDGTEGYYIFYDGNSKPRVNYNDHVSIDEDYYSLEPISGTKLDSSFYEIKQDDEIIYAVAYDGNAIDNTICQEVTKVKPGKTYLEPKFGDQYASFHFVYWYTKYNEKTEEWDWVYPAISADKLVSKQVLIDGNLMVKFRIISESKNGQLRTDATYTYYYNPTPNKRLRIDVKNEVYDWRKI